MSTAFVEAIAWDELKSSSCNVKLDKSARSYFESACVSFYSMMRNAPSIHRILVTNVDVPADCQRLLNQMDVRVIYQPFDSFDFKRDIPWHLAYYKLCALNKVVSMGEYEQYLLADTDVWVLGELEDLLMDIPQDGVGLYELDSPLNDPDRRQMVGDALALGINAFHSSFWGGEVLCGKRGPLLSLLSACAYIQNRMESESVYSKRGDEFLTFAGFADGRLPVVARLNPYVERIWTGRYYTPCRWEDKLLLHLPAEKNYTFPRAYKKLLRGKPVTNEWFVRSCSLKASLRPFSLRWLIKRGIDSLGLL